MEIGTKQGLLSHHSIKKSFFPVLSGDTHVMFSLPGCQSCVKQCFVVDSRTSAVSMNADAGSE